MSINAAGNVYTFSRSFTNPGAVTLLQIAANAARPLVPLRAWVSQHASVTSTQVAAELVRKTAAATVTAAVAADFKKHLPTQDANCTVQLGTALSGHTATAEGTDGDDFNAEGWNILNGWLYLPVPEERIVVPGGGIVGLKLLVAPPAATYRAGITFVEVG